METMFKIMRTLTWGISLTLCLIESSPAWCEENTTPDESNPWNLSPSATEFITPDSIFSGGINILDGQRQQLGRFDLLDHNQSILLIDADLVRRDAATGTWSRVSGHHLGIDHNREMTLEMERQGIWNVRLDYNEIPYQAPYTINSKTAGLGTTTQTIPKSAVAGDGNIYSIKTERERVVLNTFHTWNHNIKFNLNFRNETKEGTRQWGRGSANELTLEPVDWTMRQLEPSISFTGKDLQLQGGYNGSWFRNDNSLVDTILQGDNPATLSKHTYLSLPLDNEAHQIFLNGGYQFTPDTRATFKISYGQTLQNEHIPTIDIVGLSSNTAPSGLQGRVDTTSILLGLTTQLFPDLTLTTKIRYHDDDDRTPTWLIIQTATAQVHSTPISLRTLTTQMEGNYRLPQQTTLTAGIEYKDQKRSIPFGNDLDNDGQDNERFVPWRSKLDETTWRLRLTRMLSETINGSLGYESTRRTGSPYLDSPNIMGNVQGKINPYSIADRDRNKIRLAMDWRPLERLGFQINVENTLDHYGPDQTPYGTSKAKSQLFSMDMDYAPTDKWLLTAWYTHDRNKSQMYTGRWSGAGVHEADKLSVLEDTGNSLGLGVRNQWNDQLQLGSNFQWTRSRSSFDDTVTVDLVNAPATPAYPTGITPLPTIVTPMTRFNLFAEYKGLGPGVLRGDYIHERWSSTDWTWQFSNGTPYTYGTTTDSSQFVTDDSQTADFFGIRYTTRFK